MATLTIPYTFVAGNPAVGAEVNANFNAIITWSTQIDANNLADFTSNIVWDLTQATSNSGEAIQIISTASSSSNIIYAEHTGSINNNKAILAILDNSATSENSAAADLLISQGASSYADILRVEKQGIAKFSINCDGTTTISNVAINAGTATLSTANIDTATITNLDGVDTGSLKRIHLFSGSNYLINSGVSGEVGIYRNLRIHNKADQPDPDNDIVISSNYCALEILNASKNNYKYIKIGGMHLYPSGTTEYHGLYPVSGSHFFKYDGEYSMNTYMTPVKSGGGLFQFGYATGHWVHSSPLNIFNAQYVKMVSESRYHFIFEVYFPSHGATLPAAIAGAFDVSEHSSDGSRIECYACQVGVGTLYVHVYPGIYNTEVIVSVLGLMPV